MYRVLPGPRRAAMHIHPPHDGAANWRAWKERGKSMPAAVVLGGPSPLAYAASAPCPPGVNELMLAGFLQGGPVELVPCRTIDLAVPASADIVIEGEVACDEFTIEGPFGDHTGFYSLPDQPLVFRVGHTRRREASTRRPSSASAAHGGLLPGQGDRADFPAAADAEPGDPRLRPRPCSGRSTTSSSSRSTSSTPTRPQGDARDLGERGRWSSAGFIVVVDRT